MILSVEGEAIERLELEIQVGQKAIEKLIKQIHLSEEDIPAGRLVLRKLKKILAPGLKNNTLFSSSSSRSSHSSLCSRSSSASSSCSSHASKKYINVAAQASSSRNSSSSSSSSSRNSNSSRLSSSRPVSRSSRSSSASIFASLFSGSSSSSHSSAPLSKVNMSRLFCDFAWKNIYHYKCCIWQKYVLKQLDFYHHKFQRNHKKQVH